tara:strand:- start:133 stop:1119 length:987 start_codon:yes stop_codon:yes gene_type:complete
MKKKRLYILLCLIYFINFSYGQYPIPIGKPKPIPSFYETLKNDYYTKDTKTFDLKGKVKTVKETLISKNSTTNPIQTFQYNFNRNNQLINYQEGDSLSKFVNSFVKIEIYQFDRKKKLKELTLYEGFPRNSSKTVKFFDKEGFSTQDIYKCYECGYNYEREGDIFDYTLNYEWNLNRDTVHLKYSYILPSDHSSRHKNRLVSLTNKNDELPLSFISGIINEITIDENGNIISWLKKDFAIKSSFNEDLLYSYKYNDNNELIEVSLSGYIHGGHSTILDNNAFKLKYKNEIQYLNFDKKGNWTKKVIKQKGSNNEYVNEYIYEREIIYY